MTLHPEIIESLKIAARFGFINRSLFYEFVTNKKARMSYEIWKRMRGSDLFELFRHDLISEDYLKLSRRGKALIQSQSYSAVSAPYISLLVHDELLIRFVLANEKEHRLQNVRTEAMLKADPKSLKSNFGRSNQKYPDLLLQMQNPQGPCRLAVEYERTRKSFASYRAMLISYSIFREVDMVLFITGSEAIENAIQTAAIKVQYPFSKRPLAFARAEDVTKSPNDFPVRLGKEVIRFSNFAQDVNIKHEIVA